MKQEPHFIRADADDFHEAERQPILAYVEPAKPEHVAQMLATAVDASGDGRSAWMWVRLRDGTLMLATFPHGDTYEHFSYVEGVGHY